MATTGPVGTGLVGCGWIAELAHLPTLERSAVGRLVAIAEASPDRRAWLGRRVPGVRVYPAMDALLEDPGVEAVVVALPTAMHSDAACLAFAAGKHVYLEKPLATTVAEGKKVVEAWRRAGTTAGMGYNFRRSPIFAAARKALTSGALGPLVGLQGSFQGVGVGVEGWRARPEAGGGVLLDLVSHHVDLVAALTGDRAVSVQCVLRSARTPDDTAALQFLTEGGLAVQLQASFAAGAPVNRLDLVGREGVLRVDLIEGRPRRIQRPPGQGARVRRALNALGELHPARLLRSPGAEPSFALALEAFLEAVQAGLPFAPGLEDGLQALAVVEAAAASARSGGATVPVFLPA